jgi:TM2 domain-containing membrane protein YozV
MKSRLTAGLLALFLGCFGAHKFYLNSNVSGVFRLIFFWTWIPGLLGVYEGLVFLTMTDDDFNRKYNPQMYVPIQSQQANYYSQPEIKIPEKCPTCKNPNGQRLTVCEWCGAKTI